jgi:deoxyribodipyrimidine photo-lyase
MSALFPPSRLSILERIEHIDPAGYGKSRNYLSGAVTRLSPYIARGVITLPQVVETIIHRHPMEKSLPLIQQLAWREYFQRVWWKEKDNLHKDIRQPQTLVTHHELPRAIAEANTGVEVMDAAIRDLMHTGYLHNHARLYLAMISCNIARAHWSTPARWMYYHLLDGDIASNTLSWQWVAGSFSAKKYYANQDNINKYSGTNQLNTFLSKSYEELMVMPVPDQLQATLVPDLHTTLPNTESLQLDPSLPLLLYHSYQIDPEWFSGREANRVLVLEPSHFKQHPVSPAVMQFILELAKEHIPGIQIYVGEAKDIPSLHDFPSIHFKDHPIAHHFPGQATAPTWLFPDADYTGQGFFGYWKKCEKALYKLSRRHSQ